MSKKDKKKSDKFIITNEDLKLINSKEGITELLRKKEFNVEKVLQ